MNGLEGTNRANHTSYSWAKFWPYALRDAASYGDRWGAVCLWSYFRVLGGAPASADTPDGGRRRVD